jgi:hypothetical protein
LKPSTAVSDGPEDLEPGNTPGDPYVARLEEELKKQK